MSTARGTNSAASSEAPNQYATFYVGKLLFGIDVQRVQEITRAQEMTPVPLSSGVVRGLINLRGQIITAIDLRRRLGLEERPDGSPPMNVIVHAGSEVVSLLIDRVGDVIETDGARFEEKPDTLRGAIRDLIGGVFKLDRELMLVLDAEKAIQVSDSVS